jgi:hypothetical protein
MTLSSKVDMNSPLGLSISGSRRSDSDLQNKHRSDTAQRRTRLFQYGCEEISSGAWEDTLSEWPGHGVCKHDPVAQSVATTPPGTNHLGPERLDLFRSFLDDVRFYISGQDDYYRYPALEEALNRLA